MKLTAKRLLSCGNIGVLLMVAALSPCPTLAQDAELKPLPKLEAGKPGVLPVRIWKPGVAMSKTHREACVVFVDDPMPELQLVDLAGADQKLSALYGKKLTVVVFWNGQSAQSREQLTRIGRDVVDRFAGKGVNVVAINVGQTAEEVTKVTAELAKETTQLLDLDSSELAKVNTTPGAKTFLLDPAGKILWFDIEYSAGMSRELQNAIWFDLNGGTRQPE